MANPYYVSPLGGLDLGDTIKNAYAISEDKKAKEAQRLKLEQQEEMQKQSQALAQKAMGGDIEALQQLYLTNPDLSAQVDKGLGIQNEEQKQQISQYLQKYFSIPKEKRQDFVRSTADSTPFDFDNTLADMPLEDMDRYAMFAAGNYFTPEQLEMVKPENESITPYQQEQIRIEGEKLDIRRLEAEERSLDRQLSRETNELKRKELESKIEQNKAKQEQATRDTQAQQESAIARFDNALSTIERVENSKGFSSAIGARIPFVENIPGSDAQETIGLIDTLKSQSFLNEIKQMKGMGALSNAEGAKLESAIASLNRNMKEEAFKRSLSTIKDYFLVAKERAKKRMGVEEAVEQDNDPLGLGL